MNWKPGALPSTCGPWLLACSIATRCIRQVAVENRTLAKNMYVDDLLKILDAIEEAKTVYRESTELFVDSGFKLTKWSANAEEILQIISQDIHAPLSGLITNSNSSPMSMGPWSFSGTP